MSYDLYCYKSNIGRPDIKEAIKIIQNEQVDSDEAADAETKLQIAMKLVAYNPVLEGFGFDYEELAKLQGVSIEEARKNFDHFELSTPEGELSTQISIFDNVVTIAIPYWYAGADAEEVFKKVNIYTKIISQTAGYYVYDPQLVSVYDPMVHEFEGLSVYKKLSGKKEIAGAEASGQRRWWKFW